MTESDFEALLVQALEAFAKDNDLPIKAETLKEKGYSTDPGLIVTFGVNEFQLPIHQTVFEEE